MSRRAVLLAVVLAGCFQTTDGALSAADRGLVCRLYGDAPVCPGGEPF